LSDAVTQLLLLGPQTYGWGTLHVLTKSVTLVWQFFSWRVVFSFFYFSVCLYYKVSPQHDRAILFSAAYFTDMTVLYNVYIAHVDRLYSHLAAFFSIIRCVVGAKCFFSYKIW